MSEVRRRRNRPNSNGKPNNNLRVVHPNAAGIDIGSREHYVAVPADRGPEVVRSFGCLTPDLHALVRWLAECNIEIVAMESTSVYWVPVFKALRAAGFDVRLVDGRQTKDVAQRKSDVADCQWLQQRLTYGLLRNCFIPTEEVGALREYWRYRQSIVEERGTSIQLMQKALEQMNLQLHKVVTDISGVTGLTIIRAIIAGERDPAVLAANRHRNVKSSTETIVAALTGTYNDAQLFLLEEAVRAYDTASDTIERVDVKIADAVKAMGSDDDSVPPSDSIQKRGRRKNQFHFEIKEDLKRHFKVDLTKIAGVHELTALTVLAEVGPDLSAFPTEKHFSSWLSLAPSNRISGGKIISGYTRPNPNALATALRLAAQSIFRTDTSLGGFGRKIASKSGKAQAITATARKLACLIYRMITYGEEHVEVGEQKWQEKRQQQKERRLRKLAAELGMAVIDRQTGELCYA